jgi:phage-related protein (TIGR01555 family)
MINQFNAKQQALENMPNRLGNFKIPKAPNAEGKYVDMKMTLDNGTVMDSLPINDYDMQQGAIDPLVVNNWFMGFPVLAILAQNGINKNAVNTIADETTKHWVKITGNNAKQVKDVEKRLEELKFRKIFKKAIKKTVTYGGCFIYPKIKGDDNELALELPRNNGKLTKGCLKYFKIVEPTFCTPTSFNASNPFAKHFYEPQIWNAMGNEVHISRLMHFTYNEVEQLLLPVYQFQGQSFIQISYPYLRAFESIRNNIVGIVSRFNQRVIKTNMSNLIDYNGGDNPFNDTQTFDQRMALINAYADNFGLIALDFENEDYINVTMQLSGLHELASQALEILCTIWRTPATKLLGTAPQGFNSTGEHELINFYDFIKDIQTYYHDHIQHAIDLVCIDLFGETKDDIKFSWVPLKQMSKKEIAEINNLNANTDATLEAGGLVSTKEVRERIASDEDSGYTGIPPENQDLNVENEDEDENEESENT